MDTVEEIDLAAAGFRREAAWLAELADELDESHRDSVEDEIGQTLHRLPELYTAAQSAYLSAKAWEMEVDHYEDEERIGPAVAQRERDRMDAVVQDYRDGTDLLDDAASTLQDELGIDLWQRVDPDTQLYDPDDYVDDMEFDIEFGGVLHAVGAVEGAYRRAEELYENVL